jgi:hypothetical protein
LLVHERSGAEQPIDTAFWRVNARDAAAV